jgi:hypothetical protein
MSRHLTQCFGHIEQVEVDGTPRWDDDVAKPKDSSFLKWSELFHTSMDKCGRSVTVTPAATKQMIQAAGFVDFKQQVIKAYVSPSSLDPHEQELARWFNLGLSHSLESLSMMPLIEKDGLDCEQVRELCASARLEICTLKYRTYCNMLVPFTWSFSMCRLVLW